jgi:hypothetical protein
MAFLPDKTRPTKRSLWRVAASAALALCHVAGISQPIRVHDRYAVCYQQEKKR